MGTNVYENFISVCSLYRYMITNLHNTLLVVITKQIDQIVRVSFELTFANKKGAEQHTN